MKHQFKHRVIYQDTDAEGVVYYANYLGYFERGRTELIRNLGISLKQLKEEKGVVFAVVKVECHYQSPAFYDDEITIETEINELTNASITFNQKAICRDRILVSARTTLVALDIKKLKPRRLPEELINKIKCVSPK